MPRDRVSTTQSRPCRVPAPPCARLCTTPRSHPPCSRPPTSSAPGSSARPGVQLRTLARPPPSFARARGDARCTDSGGFRGRGPGPPRRPSRVKNADIETRNRADRAAARRAARVTDSAGGGGACSHLGCDGVTTTRLQPCHGHNLVGYNRKAVT